jgi:predicted lipoprotein with Yx(FWY)xxD motif
MRCKLFCLTSIVLFVLAGCGSSTTATTPGASAPTNTPVSAPTNTPAPVATNTLAPSSDLPIHTATATVKGASTTILTNANGFTLYYRTIDTATNVCSDGCASAWPPLLSPTGAPTSATQLPGKLDVLQDANGAQVTYNGHPLYTFASDSKAGDVNGEGFGGVWFVATPNLMP